MQMAGDFLFRQKILHMTCPKIRTAPDAPLANALSAGCFERRFTGLIQLVDGRAAITSTSALPVATFENMWLGRA